MRRASSLHSYGALSAPPFRGVAPLRRPLRVRTAMYVQHLQAVRAQRALGLNNNLRSFSGDKYRRHGRTRRAKMNSAGTELAACKTLAGDTCSGPFFAHARVQGVGASRRTEVKPPRHRRAEEDELSTCFLVRTSGNSMLQQCTRAGGSSSANSTASRRRTRRPRAAQ